METQVLRIRTVDTFQVHRGTKLVGHLTQEELERYIARHHLTLFAELPILDGRERTRYVAYYYPYDAKLEDDPYLLRKVTVMGPRVLYD